MEIIRLLSLRSSHYPISKIRGLRERSGVKERAIHWDEWRRNWTLVLCCAFGFSFSSVVNYSFGLFIQPLSAEFGWSRAETSVGLTLTAVFSVLLSPVIGVLTDRWGVRRLAIPGLALLGISVASFALANGSIWQWVGLWAVFAVVDLSVKSTVWTTAVAYAFDRERSLAIAFTLGGVSFALVVGPPLAEALISGFGWRWAFVPLFPPRSPLPPSSCRPSSLAVARPCF